MDAGGARSSAAAVSNVKLATRAIAEPSPSSSSCCRRRAAGLGLGALPSWSGMARYTTYPGVVSATVFCAGAGVCHSSSADVVVVVVVARVETVIVRTGAGMRGGSRALHLRRASPHDGRDARVVVEGNERGRREHRRSVARRARLDPGPRWAPHPARNGQMPTRTEAVRSGFDEDRSRADIEGVDCDTSAGGCRG